jgi:hypothetical protein
MIRKDYFVNVSRAAVEKLALDGDSVEGLCGDNAQRDEDEERQSQCPWQAGYDWVAQLRVA